MAINLSLNDFRNVLGNVNDGNVVLKQDQSGIEKANYGNRFLNLFRSVRTAAHDPQENIQIRQSLLTAIHNSAEGKVLSRADMERIYAALGMPEGTDANTYAAPLARRELKAVIDIIDGATANDALIEEDVDALEAKGLLDKPVSDGVKSAMDEAKCFDLPNDPELRTGKMREIFGEDFKGRSPAEMDRFVRQNMAVIREQVFDMLYWTNPSLKDFSKPDDLAATYIEPDSNGIVPGGEQTVTVAFKEVVGELMEKFASNEVVTTKIETVAPRQDDVKLLDKEAEDVWKNNVKGDEDYLKEVTKAFATRTDESGVYASLQMNRAATAVKNHIRTVFNTTYKENGLNPQKTETAFKKAMEPLMSVLKAFTADVGRVGDKSGMVMADFAERLGAAVSAKHIGAHALADAALKALGETSKGFSARGLVEEYVNANFSYAADKEAVIGFFMQKIGAAGKEGGIGDKQAAKLVEAQEAGVSGEIGAGLKRDLKTLLFDPLKGEYDTMVANMDPQKVRDIRTKRNNEAFQSLLKANPGHAKKTENEALISLKVSVLIGKYDYDAVYKMGITDSSGSQSIKTGEGGAPDPDALTKLDNALLDMDDREFEFYSQYAGKGFWKADSDIGVNCSQFGQVGHGSVFKDALIDGAIGVSSIPVNAVPLLKNLVMAQVFAPTDNNENVTSLRDMLPPSGRSSSLARDFLVRIQERIGSSDAGNALSPLVALSNNADDKEAGQKLTADERGNIMQLRGFGTLDPSRILKLFAEAGIDLAPLDGNDAQAKVDVYEKVLCLSTIAAMSGFKLDGVLEFTERVIGKPFAEVTFTDVVNALNKNKLVGAGGMRENIVVANDPIAKLSGAKQTAKRLFAGELSLAEAKLSAQDATDLLKAVRTLASAEPGTVATTGSLNFAGTGIELTRLATGGLSVKVGGLPMRAVFDAHGLVRMIENEITSKPSAFSADVVISALPSLDDVASGAVPLVRARELYAKTAAAKTGTLPVMFSAYTTAQLRDVAVRAVKGEFTQQNLPKAPPATYNSGAMIEMHDSFAKTSAAEIDACVKIATAAPRSIAERRTIAPDDATVRNITADLFLNKDTWAFDAAVSDGQQKGERVRKLLVEYAPELSFMLKGLGVEGDDLFIYLPQNVRDAVKDVFADIKKLDISRLADTNSLPEGARDALDAIEKKIDAVATQLAEAMQAKVTALFAPHGAGEAKQDWQKTFAELNGKEGIDESTRQGKFTMSVLRNYFKSAAQVDKRAMLSAFIRNTGPDATDAKQVAELLKGAGPLLQKMLQGLPLSSFDPDTQLALKDMKSRLLPIPDEAVKAQMLELVRSSNGNILSIEVKRSLGAASVGQAFLCTIKTKDHPHIGEECVIKLLRPNVDTAVQREKAMIDQIIGDDMAMKETFDGQYRKILEEFDLTLESTNIGIGLSVYERPKGDESVHTMQMVGGSQPTMTAMILKKADGNTFDNVIDTVRTDVESIIAPLRHETMVGETAKTVLKAKTPAESAFTRRLLLYKAAQLNDRRNHILSVAKAWFDNALFGNGFFHGDLHGGNLMTGPSGTTFIDFGNCSRLSTKDQAAIQLLLAAVVAGGEDDTPHVISNFKKLMPTDAQTLFDEKFAKGSDAMKRLTDALHRGSSLDLMSRVQAFLAIVQGEDVPVPAPLQNFVQSYVRLCDIVSDIDRTVADIEISANSVYADMPLTAPVEGEKRTVSLIKGLVRAYVGDANTPFSAEAVQSAAADFARFANSAEGKEEIKALTHDPERIRAELAPVLEMLNAVKIYRRYDLVPVLSNVGSLGAVRELDNLFKEFMALDAAGKIKNGQVDSDDEREKSIFTRLESEVSGIAQSMAEEMAEFMSGVDSEGASSFRNFAVKIDKSVTDICVDVIQDHSTGLGVSAFLEYGIMSVGGFKGRLEAAFQSGTEMQVRMKNVGPVLAGLNRNLDPGVRLSGPEMATLARATSTFLVQMPRPDAEKNWGSNAGKRAGMLAALSYNISRAATAMKLNPGERLPDAAIRHAVLNMGLIDGKLVESITSLSEADYNAILTDAGKEEAQNGAYGLSTALATLRGAEGLLAQVQPEEEEE